MNSELPPRQCPKPGSACEGDGESVTYIYIYICKQCDSAHHRESEKKRKRDERRKRECRCSKVGVCLLYYKNTRMLQHKVCQLLQLRQSEHLAIGVVWGVEDDQTSLLSQRGAHFLHIQVKISSTVNTCNGGQTTRRTSAKKNQGIFKMQCTKTA